jgi:hypothetical protein
MANTKNKKQVETLSRLASTIFFSILGGLSFFTACWMACGWLTPGDLFANGSPWADNSLLVTLLAGAIVGYKAKSVRLRMAILVAGIASLCFWLVLPMAWWSKPPR